MEKEEDYHITEKEMAKEKEEVKEKPKTRKKKAIVEEA